MMRRRVIVTLLLGAAVAGCAGMTSSGRVDKFDATVRHYERAIRWGEFPTAYVLAAPSATAAPDFQRLQDIRVTSYEVLSAPQANADATEIAQVVEIRYVHVRQMSERRFVDRQQWVYVPDQKRWKLQSPFPAFP